MALILTIITLYLGALSLAIYFTEGDVGAAIWGPIVLVKFIGKGLISAIKF